MTGAVTAGGSTLFDDTEAFDRALAAALTGRGGLCVVSEPTGGKSALLSRAIAALPGLGVAVVRLGAAAGPREIEAAARPRAAAPANRRLILVEEAHLLSVAALRTLNGLAAGPQLVAGGAGLLLSGTPDLLQRLVSVRAERLLHFPAFTLDPANDTALPAGRPAEPRRQGGGIDRLSQAAMAVAALVIAGSVAVFVMAPSDAGRRPPVDLRPTATAEPPAPGPADAPPDLIPTPVLEPLPVEPMLAPAPRAELPGATLGGPGLLLVARDGDTLQRLYRSVYEGSRPPPFRDLEKANPHPIRPGVVVVFPTPPDGWRKP